MIKKFTFFLITFWLVSHTLYAQIGEGVARKKLDKAIQDMNLARYELAAASFTELYKQYPTDTLVNYGLGYCYAHSDNPNEQVKGIPYFEFALPSRSEDIPTTLPRDLAHLYHKAYRFAEAINLYTKYKNTLPKNSAELKTIYRQVEMCRSGVVLMKKPLEVVIQNMGSEINTKYTEYSPIINGEEDLLIYTTLRPINVIDPKSGESREAECILYSRKESGSVTWTSPKRLDGCDYNVASVALTPDAQKIILFVGGTNGGGDLYIGDIDDGKVVNLRAFESKINSAGLENSGSLTSDEQVLYFSSNRAGGLGGQDLYKIEKDKNGRWGNPVNLGAEVNTKYDEEAPFIHPDKKTLYFHSSGHNSMGNDDIFKTVMVNGKFTKPTNMGYPINSTYNDNFFVVSPDGKKGYFSSDRPGGFGGQDIYFLGIPEEQDVVPLTLVKGRVLAGDSLKPVPTKIKVIDKQTKQLVRGVYHPDRKTGNYLIIFPPGKNYDMIVEAKGYVAHTININIPDQTYFHELYQQIHLKPVKQFDVVVGQQVTVQNAFKDVNPNKGSDKIKVTPRMANEAMLVRDSLDVYDLMDNVIAASDSTAFEYLLDLMFKVNPLDKVNFQDSAVAEPPVTATFFFDEKDKLVPMVVGNDTIYTAPVLYTDSADLHKNRPVMLEGKQPEATVFKSVTRIYFDTDKADLKDEYYAALDKVIAQLKEYPSVAVEVDGYADSDGNKDYNLKLSNRRAKEVLKYMTGKGVLRRRVVAKGFGQLLREGKIKSDTDKQKDRKVEIKIVKVPHNGK